jgi:hypothetical protein
MEVVHSCFQEVNYSQFFCPKRKYTSYNSELANGAVLSPLIMGWCHFLPPPCVTLITLASAHFTVFIDPAAFRTCLHIFCRFGDGKRDNPTRSFAYKLYFSVKDCFY